MPPAKEITRRDQIALHLYAVLVARDRAPAQSADRLATTAVSLADTLLEKLDFSKKKLNDEKAKGAQKNKQRG